MFDGTVKNRGRPRQERLEQICDGCQKVFHLRKNSEPRRFCLKSCVKTGKKKHSDEFIKTILYMRLGGNSETHIGKTLGITKGVVSGILGRNSGVSRIRVRKPKKERKMTEYAMSQTNQLLSYISAHTVSGQFAGRPTEIAVELGIKRHRVSEILDSLCVRGRLERLQAGSKYIKARWMVIDATLFPKFFNGESVLWTPEKIEKVKVGWAAGMSVPLIGQQIGVGKNSVKSKVDELIKKSILTKRKDPVIARENPSYTAGRPRAEPPPQRASVPQMSTAAAGRSASSVRGVKWSMGTLPKAPPRVAGVCSWALRCDTPARGAYCAEHAAMVRR